MHGGRVCQKHGGMAPQVKRKAAERLADLIDPDRALREGVRLAYSDIRELFDVRGNLRPVKEWPAEVAAAIAGVEVVKRRSEGETDTVTKVKVWDKPSVLGMLYKHLGLLKDRVELSDPDGKPVSFTLKIGDREGGE